MNIAELKEPSRSKPFSAVARDLGLHPQFASTAELQQTVLLMARHIDQLRFEVDLLRAEVRRRWWHRFIGSSESARKRTRS